MLIECEWSICMSWHFEREQSLLSCQNVILSNYFCVKNEWRFARSWSFEHGIVCHFFQCHFEFAMFQKFDAIVWCTTKEKKMTRKERWSNVIFNIRDVECKRTIVESTTRQTCRFRRVVDQSRFTQKTPLSLFRERCNREHVSCLCFSNNFRLTSKENLTRVTKYFPFGSMSIFVASVRQFNALINQ